MKLIAQSDMMLWGEVALGDEPFLMIEVGDEVEVTKDGPWLRVKASNGAFVEFTNKVDLYDSEHWFGKSLDEIREIDINS